MDSHKKGVGFMENKDLYSKLSYNKKLRELKRTVKEINKHYKIYETIYKSGQYNDKQFFNAITQLLRKEVKELISKGMEEDKALKKVLPKAYGIVKLACKEELRKTYYDVQLMAGILLNDGYISEMATGEGKTITAALPVYLNALLGKGAHVVTPNVYLANRDYEEMHPLFELLGLSCGLVDEMKPSDRKDKILLKAKQMVDNATEKRYYSPKELDLLEKRAIETASREVSEQDIKNRQRQYNCDVTYGSSHAFAFDYLYDLIEDNPNRLRLRSGNPNFIVVDEADAVLFDDAITSYNISGTQKDASFAITNKDKQMKKYYTSLATRAMDYITSNKELLKEIEEPYDFHKYGEQNDEDFDESTPAIYYCSKSKEFTFTYIGRVLLYQIFCKDEMNKILSNNKDLLSKLNYRGKPISSLPMNPRILALLIEGDRIKELTDSFNRFMMNEFQNSYPDITNAAYAWLFLEKDIDYKYVVPSDSENPKYEREIAILMDGRIAEGRVYSNGMQQAVEAKEKTLNARRRQPYIIKESILSDTLASIPVAAFYGRYNKFSGMTGTSAKEAFQELYQLNTFEVPRNKKKNVKDYGDRLYRTTNEKYQAILDDVIKTHQQGQPILLTTTSLGESMKLYNYISNGLKRYGIFMDIPVLNADVNLLRREARIIAKAGKLGAITIATDMAGRGTDIKLGGPRATQQQEEEVLKAGGLKIIGSGHFQFNRSDRQMKGRTGRQGNVGEIVFYNDLDDLKRICVDQKVIDKFDAILKHGPIIESQIGSRMVQNVIEETQAKAEELAKEIIQNNQRVEVPVASCRNKYHNMMEQIKRSGNYHEVVRKLSDTVLSDIFYISYEKDPNLGELSSKLRTSKLNIALFNSYLREYFGFSLKPEAFKNFKTKDELEKLIKSTIIKRLRTVQVSNELVNSYLHRIWFYFEEYVEHIKNQNQLAGMVPGNITTLNMEAQINEALYQQIVREVLHPIRDMKNDHFGIYQLQLHSNSTVDFLNPNVEYNKQDLIISDQDPCEYHKVRK